MRVFGCRRAGAGQPDTSLQAKYHTLSRMGSPRTIPAAPILCSMSVTGCKSGLRMGPNHVRATEFIARRPRRHVDVVGPIGTKKGVRVQRNLRHQFSLPSDSKFQNARSSDSASALTKWLSQCCGGGFARSRVNGCNRVLPIGIQPNMPAKTVGSLVRYDKLLSCSAWALNKALRFDNTSTFPNIPYKHTSFQ